MMSWFYLALRLYIASVFWKSTVHKLDDPAWRSGDAVAAMWRKAVAVPPPPAKPPIHFSWYRGILEALLARKAYRLFGPMVVWGSMAVAIGMISGAATRFAALGGLVMNLNFALAGSTGSNPLLMIAEMLLLKARGKPGEIGIDGIFRRR